MAPMLAIRGKKRYNNEDMTWKQGGFYEISQIIGSVFVWLPFPVWDGWISLFSLQTER
jgi:hypothetical protein